MSKKMGPVGGNSGNVFDDGVFDGVKKIIVEKERGFLSYIRIEYEKNGNSETREHGTGKLPGELKEFVVDYPKEVITSVGGSYDHVNEFKAVVIKSLIFKTSYGRISPILGETNSSGSPAGTKFMLEGENGGKLLGFHGRSGQAIDAIGAYFSLVPEFEKIEAVGGNSGNVFDDGVFDGVKKIIVEKERGCVPYIRIEYEKNGNSETREHGTGKLPGELKEFVVDYPNEFITSVGGSYGHVNDFNAVVIKSLIFKTSYGRISPIFGETNSSGSPAGNQFMLEGKNGGKLLGFHGRSVWLLMPLEFTLEPVPVYSKVVTTHRRGMW